MSTSLLTILIGAIAVILLWTLFVGFIQPIWALIDLNHHPQLHGKKKTAWLVGILILWTPVSLAYAVLASPSRKLYRSTLASLIFLAFLCVLSFLNRQKIEETVNIATAIINLSNMMEEQRELSSPPSNNP